ncbi:MAG: hypothetical protein P0S94_04395, partial [Simkaniaceae bacterium]|nr:hypothetical protein [Simkaniaceae bacterium]
FLIRERNRLGRWDSSKKAVLDEQIDNYTHVIASYDKQIHQEHVDQNTAARAANESIPAIEAATSRVKYASEKVQKDEEAFCELQARISDAQAIIYKAKSDIINCGYATTCLKEKAEVLLDEIKGLNSSKKRKRKEAHKAQRTIVELNQAIARLSKFARFTQLF